MDPQGGLTERFEENRPRLRAVAYRMLGSLSEAEDAVQEAWLRLGRTDPATVGNLGGWLTTVVSRVCLNMLRSRKSRREEPIDEPRLPVGEGAGPEEEAVLADSVGVALLVVLDALTPAERLAFVLHDLFAMPFEEIGAIVGRSPDAARQLASRARRRVRGSTARPGSGTARQREVVDAFMKAVRAGDLEGLLAVLDPDAVLHIEAAARRDAPPEEVGQPREIRGAAAWARQFIALSRGMASVRSVQSALVEGSIGVVFAPRGRLARALKFAIGDDKIARIDVIGGPARLRDLDVAVLETPL